MGLTDAEEGEEGEKKRNLAGESAAAAAAVVVGQISFVGGRLQSRAREVFPLARLHGHSCSWTENISAETERMDFKMEFLPIFKINQKKLKEVNFVFWSQIVACFGCNRQFPFFQRSIFAKMFLHLYRSSLIQLKCRKSSF